MRLPEEHRETGDGTEIYKLVEQNSDWVNIVVNSDRCCQEAYRFWKNVKFGLKAVSYDSNGNGYIDTSRDVFPIPWNIIHDPIHWRYFVCDIHHSWKDVYNLVLDCVNKNAKIAYLRYTIGGWERKSNNRFS